MISVVNNLTAMNTQRQFGINSKAKAVSTEKLSSGYKINRAADDAAGLAISEKLRLQIRGLNQGSANIQDGVSMCQIADGALNEVDELLHRANVLAVQSANGTNSETDREYIQQEIDQIKNEIDRIGSTTTFNEIHIFGKEEIEEQVGPISKLVSCPSADAGKLAEAYPIQDGFYPSASIDLSKVSPENIKQLDGGSFSFECPYGCGETFEITFANSAESSGPVNSGRTHQYSIGIANATSGSDIIDTLYTYLEQHPANSGGNTWLSGLGVQGVGVSHSSALIKDGNRLIIASDTKFANATDAEYYMKGNSDGKVDCSSLTNIFTPEPQLSTPIQCSATLGDKEIIHTRIIDCEYIGLDPLDVTTQELAGNAINKIKYAMGCIADMRSELGATQNRLEHSININNITAENETAAESVIRDTDMAKEMVQYSLKNILEQAGNSMMAQANQSNEMVLSLLQ